MKKTLLTIDWDYFIPEDPFLDFGHNESIFMQNEIWHMRAISSNIDLIEKIQTNKEEDNFWKFIKNIYKNIKDVKLIRYKNSI
jgi:hypothetical protein